MASTRAGVEVWGHRGWAARWPDNSMVAFGAAFGVVPTVEIDVRRTRDGHLILSHDPAIGGLVIVESDWADIEILDIGAGQRPVLLGEALAAFPDRRFDIEVKNHPGEPGFETDGSTAVEVATRARAQDLLSSFYWPALDVVRDRLGDRAPATGLLLDTPVSIDAAVEHATSGGHHAVIPSWQVLQEHGADTVVGSAHEKGLDVYTWTVNDLDLARRLADAGVDAIITDDPGRMSAVLARGS